MSDLTMKEIIENSFAQYAGAVLQSRALIDVRDGLKPSARQIFYSMYERKLTADKPYKKTANAVGMALADYYIHGDSSCLGVIMRAGQGFSMRYPLVDVKGNAGTQMQGDDYAAPRYTESRLSKMSDLLFGDIDKDTISEWRDNYDNTKQYPAVLPSKGFYNIVNGVYGIGIGMSCSCPQYNLIELNNALIKLLWDKEISYDEIYCAPDFATGGFLLNESQVKESMKNGEGFACKLRAKVEFDQKDRCLIVTEIPYGVYTNTICKELDSIIDSEENLYIDTYKDLTGKTPLIKIYLKRTANVDKTIKFLYKKTSLQSHYGINFTMLENGRRPRVFGWKEMLLSFLDHQEEVYRRGFEFDLNKIKARLHIVEGIIIALANIEEVIKIIKNSSSSKTAAEELTKNFLLTEIQAKAVLEIKLARLAHLEVKKLEDERDKLIKEKTRLEEILSNENLFKKEIEKDLVKVRDSFGDSRRTVVLNIEKDEDEEPVEIKNLIINLTNKNNIFVEETTNLYNQKRGGRGLKFKLQKDEIVISANTLTTTDTVLFFTENGFCYNLAGSELPIGEKTALESLLSLSDEKVCTITVYSNTNLNKENNTIIFTKNGFMKKTLTSEYITRRKFLKALALEDGDKVVSVLFNNEDKVGILTNKGHFLICETKDIRPIGRVSKGIKSIKIENENEYVISAKNISKEITSIATISKLSYCKITPIQDFPTANRYTKGGIIQSIKDNDELADFEPIQIGDKEVLIVSTSAQIRINIEEIPILHKKTQGVKTIKLPENEKVVTFIKI